MGSSRAQHDRAPGGRARVRVAVWVLALVAVGAALAVGLAGRGGGTTGRPAPALPAQALVGQPVTLAALTRAHGTAPHAALVLFWASWCAPCQHEAPAVERFARSAAGRGRIVGIDYGESESGPPRAFLRRYRWTFPNLSDPRLSAGSAYDVANLPGTFAIDARGRIRQRLYGPQTEASLTRALRAAEG